MGVHRPTVPHEKNGEISVTHISTAGDGVATVGRVMGESREAVTIAFYGVRGSTPCSCPELQRYGGNTACVTIETPGQDPIVLDLGTGLRMWGLALGRPESLTVHALVTHLHWDHVQGLPFFKPLQCETTTLNVYGPGEGGESLGECFNRFMSPPFFPIRTKDLPATIEFRDALCSDFSIGDASIMARPVPHTGPTAGYRVTYGDLTVAYVPDHQQPVDTSTVAESVLELCDGVDMLIHDAQLRADEFPDKSDWGHCTPAYAVEVARQSGAKSLVLFHHDPSHDDAELDRMTADACELANAAGIPMLAAAEGLKLTLGAGL